MMRVLQLTKKYPWPLNDGELIAIQALAAGLQQNGVTVDLLAMNTSKHYYNGPIPEPLKQIYQQIASVDVDNHPKLIPGILNLFSVNSYHITRFITAAFEKALEKQLQKQEYQVVLLETIYLCPYIPIIRKLQPKAKIVLRAHNLEHQIWDRLKINSRSLLKRTYLGIQIPRLKKFELDCIHKIDLLCPISQLDAEQFHTLGYQGKMQVVETGLNLQQYNYKAPDLTPPVRCAFIGSLDWPPNQEGLLWFAENIWPKIRKQFPDAEFHVAGKNAPGGFEKKFPQGFHFHGKVADASEFIQNYPLFVVPLLSGSGIRIKVLEAIALGRVVVSTSVGAEGIAARSENALFLCDQAMDFIETMKHCYNDPQKAVAGTAASREQLAAAFEYRNQAARLVDALA